MHGGEATPGVEEKGVKKDENAGIIGCWTTRGIDERKRVSNTLGVGAADACGVAVGGVLPDQVVESGQTSPGVASSLRLV